jgi:uncharacterized protein YjiS (DUF1127 family)
MSTYAATQQIPQPASTRPRHTAFQSKGRTYNKETMAMKNIFQTIRQWRRGNAAAKMLNRLDDHMLADIGIARGDISKAVHIFH